MNGDLDISNGGWLRIESMKATQINKKKPWCILTPEFKSPPNPTEKQVYLRKFAERMQSHIYKGQTMHWGNENISVLMWFMAPDPKVSIFKDEKTCHEVKTRP